jgi:F-type H+-transporting ATPase subunit b
MKRERRIWPRVGRWLVLTVLVAAVNLAALPAWAEEASEAFLGLPTLVWKVLNFVVFFGLLGYFLARPLQAFFRNRRQGLARQAEEAEQARQQAIELRTTIERKVTELSGEIAALKHRLHEEGERERDALERQGEAEAARLVGQIELEANRRLAEARRKLAAEAANVAADLALELLRRELTEEDRQRIFAATLERLQGRAQGGQA